MLADSRQLLAGDAVRHLEHASVSRAPDSLRHVPEVVARESHVEVEVSHREEERGRPAEHRHPYNDHPCMCTSARHQPGTCRGPIRCERPHFGAHGPTRR